MRLYAAPTLPPTPLKFFFKKVHITFFVTCMYLDSNCFKSNYLLISWLNANVVVLSFNFFSNFDMMNEEI